MSLRKPIEKSKDKSDKEVEKLIRSGALVKEDRQEKKDQFISLRVPCELLEKVDEAVRTTVTRIPRTSWILEAIHEKLKRLSNER